LNSQQPFNRSGALERTYFYYLKVMWRHNPDPTGNARFQSLKAGVYTSGCQRLINRSKNGNGLLRPILEFEFIFIIYTVITLFFIFSV